MWSAWTVAKICDSLVQTSGHSGSRAVCQWTSYQGDLFARAWLSVWGNWDTRRSREQHWLNWVFKASCWRDPLCVCICEWGGGRCMHLWVRRGLHWRREWGCGPRGLVYPGASNQHGLGSSGSYQMGCLLQHTILYIFLCSFHCLSFCSAREGNRMRPSVLFVLAWVLCFLSGMIRGASRVCMYICIGCMCVCTYREYMLRFATGSTWGLRAHLSSIGLPDTATLYSAVALLLIRTCSESARG